MNHTRLKRRILILCLSALSASATAQSGGPAAGAVAGPPKEAIQNTAKLAASVAVAAGIAALAKNSTTSNH